MATGSVDGGLPFAAALAPSFFVFLLAAALWSFCSAFVSRLAILHCWFILANGAAILKCVPSLIRMNRM